MFEYRAKVLKVHDGDTMTVAIDCGFDIVFTQKLRLYGLNAPELANPDGSGRKALAFVMAWLVKYAPSVAPNLVTLPSSYVLLRTVKDRQEKFGRYLATVEQWTEPGAPPGADLNQDLLASGNAVPYLVN